MESTLEKGIGDAEGGVDESLDGNSSEELALMGGQLIY